MAQLYRIASGVRMAFLGFVGEDLDGEVHDAAGDGRADGAEVGWDHSRIATRKTELVQGAGGDVVGVVGQRGHREDDPLCDRDQQTVVGVVLDASLATLVCAPVAAAALGGEVERVQVADRTFPRARPSSAASVLGEGAPA
ncbi:hypothetical protein OG930_03780 [Streptomyces sp. NBC_01799]|uniref:hypothetical protein n=1 Tax=Streptomyces sp. NBC_01800 TaxID=2975945 RepID=UPI002DDC70E2|nr:hypothetical protein [Streptomyces sp. NBC_01800]WSA66206.1 hypothetical protein OIE65_03865 [Streptomyces sp. NBC_01800]WSA74805.1 hypothetical protein OG930_03780 [Streptomyces sp. NBC_01799]